jgi:hypothetical protein
MLREFSGYIDANRAFIPNYRALEEGRVSRSTTRKGKIVSALLEKLAGYIVGSSGVRMGGQEENEDLM